MSEVDRISTTTTFNGVNLLSAGTTVDLQVGLDARPTAASRSSTTTVLERRRPRTSVSTAAAAQSALGDDQHRDSNVAQQRGNAPARWTQHGRPEPEGRARELSSAESRIRDADIAEETANMTRGTILQQAGVSILAQANQQPQLALQLLR